jgi:ABC-type glycerol-3-phosphate transport system substrate-binding protein
VNVKKLSRREFLIAAGAVAGGSILAACAPAATEAPAEQPTEAPMEATEAPAALPDTSEGEQVIAELEPPPEAPPFDGGPSWDPADLAGQEMLLWGLQYDPHVERYGLLAETFEKRTGAKVEVQPQPSPFEAYMTAAAAGTPPDCMCMMGLHSHNLIRQQAIVPVKDAIFDPLGLDIDKWWRPGSIGCYIADGQYWGVPTEDNWCGYNVATRIDLIEQVGGEAQEIWDATTENTWFNSYDDMYRLAELLQQTDDAGTVTVWGLNSSGWDLHSLSSIMRSLGVDFFDSDTQTYDFDNEACVEGLRLLVERPFELGIEAVLGMSQINAFVAGQTALARGNGSTPGEGWKLDIQGENVIAPPPVAGETPLFFGEGGWGFEMAMNPPHPEVATEFMKFMCTYEAQYIFSQIYGGSPPATWGLVQPELCDIYLGDHPIKRGLRRLLKALENCEFFGVRPAPNGPVSEAMTAMREGTMTAEEAAAQIQATAQEAHDQWLSEA